MEKILEFILNRKKYELQAYPNVAILGNAGCGKTSIARKIVKELILLNDVKVEVIGSKADIEYNDINCQIDGDESTYSYTNYIYDLYKEYEDRKNNKDKSPKLIVIDDLSDIIPYNNLDEEHEFTIKLKTLLMYAWIYGMYFIIISQRITDTAYKPEFRDKTHIHIYMRCNNDDESKFLIGDNTLTSLKRGEFKIELT